MMAIVIAMARPGASGVDARKRPPRMALKFITAMIERSMPPVSMASIMASERMANSGNWKAIDEKFVAVRKSSGLR
jgi:hypothetical protein